ncbi:hypothetical protein Slin15195_G083040 [Septoria linicola]|uniref:DUF7730 domain-containing protein n=1 Tax=Septoria linicola TaxID=215465 RepID=A0A9Q9AYR8_9PEZI|nr:hypothetical protein Slin14017_G085550 [Septoria linicola]USW54985.1 hypothetical protein Slin15195_G083040 [Septoria linicola]
MGLFKLILKSKRSQRPPRRPRSPPPAEPPVRSLPEIRPRRLTISEGVDQQSQSHFVSTIPAELRLMIWEYALAPDSERDVLHIDLGDGNLKQVRCYESVDHNMLGFRHQCWHTVWTREKRNQRFWADNEVIDGIRKIRSLLLTCKLLYVESVELLYRLTIFDFRRSDTILWLPAVILPHRFQDIRHIRLSTAFVCPVQLRDPVVVSSDAYLHPDDAERWFAECDILSGLHQLQTLGITVAFWPLTPGRPEQVDEDSVIAVLTPLKALHATQYRVTITEQLTNRIRRCLGSSPFQLLQREGRGTGFPLGPDEDRNT